MGLAPLSQGRLFFQLSHENIKVINPDIGSPISARVDPCLFYSTLANSDVGTTISGGS